MPALQTLERRLRDFGIGAVQDQRAIGFVRLLHELDIRIRAVARIIQEQEFSVFTLADALVIDLLDLGDLRIDVRFVAGDVRREQVLAHKRLLMTEQHGFAAKLMRVVAGADLDGLHQRRGRFGQGVQSVLRHIGALIDRDGALRDLHRERHTRGAAALLTILFRSQLKDIQTFECHDIFPPSVLTSSCR